MIATGLPSDPQYGQQGIIPPLPVKSDATDAASAKELPGLLLAQLSQYGFMQSDVSLVLAPIQR